MNAWFVQTAIASTALLAVVLAIRLPVRRWFGAPVAYGLWALPALRLFVPPLPFMPHWPAPPPLPVPSGNQVTVLVLPDAVPAPVMIPPEHHLWPALLLAWAIGAAAFFGWHLFAHRRSTRLVLADAVPLATVAGVRVVCSSLVEGPLAFGLWQRWVVVPADWCHRFTPAERKLALAHELAHHGRGDLYANWAALIFLSLHWPNPLAWVGWRAFRADQEAVTDAVVLARRGATPAGYARTIVKAATGRAPLTACPLSSLSTTKRRLRMLFRPTPSLRRRRSGTAAVAGLTVAALAISSSGGQAAVQLDGAAGRVMPMPAPVVAPAPPAPPVPVVVSTVPAVQIVHTPAPPTPPPAVSGRKHVVVITRNGQTSTYEGADADRYIAEHGLPVPPVPPGGVRGPTRLFFGHIGGDGRAGSWSTVDMPQVVSLRCPGDATRPIVEHGEKDGTPQVIICTNRMEAMTRDAERLAMNSETIERSAMGNARASLAMARAAIERDRNLTDDQRREALAGVDRALAEVRAPN